MIVNSRLFARARRCALLLTLLAVSATPAAAGETGQPAQPTPVKTKQARAAKSVDEPVKLYGAQWHRGAAVTVAAAARAQKPAFLVRMLGELDGKT